MYSIYPLLNTVISRLTQKQHLAYNCTFFILYFCIGSIKGLFYINSFVIFIGVYFFVAYVKRYQPKFISSTEKNIICLLTGIVLLILLQISVNIIGLKIDFIGSRVLHFASTVNNNPIVLLIAFSLFNIFRNMKFQNKFINYISSLTMLLFVVHYNYIYVNYISTGFMFRLWETTGKINYLLFIFAYAVLFFIFSTVIAVIYNKLLQPWVHKLAEVILKILLKLYGRFECFMLKIE